ncbi:uncharacterized protein F5147DRAFT_778963 [Suillus discolor]|uniref:Uncharacterized protein n=1 Tax=Suillus discolor TaxID=1912936 RepID=A0A9P7JNS8_9AGAM|nr:uncharacterized protein F5147DRAFT_778963 [Suillus discolor]KAG2094656.1 hypothetical protein F5147DRAFT_778963 [Suillus discolor]
MASTPLAFNLPPIIIPGTLIFPKFDSISVLDHAVTNNVFTLDVFLTNGCFGGDGSPVTRHKQASLPVSTFTINPVSTMRESSPLIHLVGTLPVPHPTVPIDSMPSTSTLHTMITGPSNMLVDGQSILASLPNQSFAP